MKKAIFLIIFLFGIHSGVFSKDCDSELDSHLIKLSDKTSFNTELVFGTYVNNQTGDYKDYYKPMINIGYEYVFNDKTLFYYNGAFKYRLSKPEPTEEEALEESGGHGKGLGAGAYKFGFRHLYIQNKGENYQFKAGFLTTTLNEQLLVDERGAGIDYVYQAGALKTHFFATQMISQMAREDMSCVSKAAFISREISAKPETLSDSFAGIQFELDFSKKKIETKTGEDEFEEVKQEDQGKKPFKLGFTYYVEGYEYLGSLKHFADFHQNYQILGLDYSLEGAFQFFHDDIALGYIGKLSKTFFTDSVGTFKVFSGYTGWQKIAGESSFMPVNSNLFLSDRMQYLTYDKYILFYGLNYRVSKRLQFEVINYHKLSRNSSRELDVNTTLYYTESAKVKLGYNLIEKPDASNQYYHQFYIEIRHLF